MKRIIAVIMSVVLVILSFCFSVGDGCGKVLAASLTESAEDSSELSFNGLDDKNLHDFIKEEIYRDLAGQLDGGDYRLENVETIYYPKSYIEKLASNSTKNIYFGFTSEELNKQFQGVKYVFTLGEDGQTIVIPMDTLNEDVYVKALENVLIGTGVILICVTVSIAAAPATPAVSMIFAASATTAKDFALGSGAIGFAAAAILEGYKTENMEQAIKAGVRAAGEGFKWGAITGAVAGGAKETFFLKKAMKGGLTLNQAAAIIKATDWPVEAVSAIHSPAEAQIYMDANVVPLKMSNGQWAFIREIDWNQVDSLGRTNAQRVAEYALAPLDPGGMSYELHHVGMEADSPLAILTNAEHHSGSNYKILHYKKEGKNVADAVWKEQKQKFWEEILKLSGM